MNETLWRAVAFGKASVTHSMWRGRRAHAAYAESDEKECMHRLNHEEPVSSSPSLRRQLLAVEESALLSARRVLCGALSHDAADRTIEKFEDQILAGKQIAYPTAWASIVARRIALNLLAHAETEPIPDCSEISARNPEDMASNLPSRQAMSAMLSDYKEFLTKRQYHIMTLLCEGQSYVDVAQLLNRTVANVVDVGKRALARLETAKKWAMQPTSTISPDSTNWS